MAVSETYHVTENVTNKSLRAFYRSIVWSCVFLYFLIFSTVNGY
jgi:hypothetical protein